MLCRLKRFAKTGARACVYLKSDHGKVEPVFYGHPFYLFNHVSCM
jgi:hypothetical protein